MEVHKELGCGFLEAVYQEALAREFDSQRIEYLSQPIVRIKYKGHYLKKTYQPDYICFDNVVVEIKAISGLTSYEEGLIINYLKATDFNVGLLINFGSKSLGYKRFVSNL